MLTKDLFQRKIVTVRIDYKATPFLPSALADEMDFLCRMPVAQHKSGLQLFRLQSTPDRLALSKMWSQKVR